MSGLDEYARARIKFRLMSAKLKNRYGQFVLEGRGGIIQFVAMVEAEKEEQQRIENLGLIQKQIQESRLEIQTRNEVVMEDIKIQMQKLFDMLDVPDLDTLEVTIEELLNKPEINEDDIRQTLALRTAELNVVFSLLKKYRDKLLES